ncbi:MAG: hypothetical protein HN856_05660 [Gammaproteobacteria bacterium]|nr:hypothetical protein [Gammaproteobacteria bacterium]
MAFKTHFWLIALLGLLASCSSKGPNTANANANDRKTPWFCQPGDNPDAWNCVQSETLAKNPKPAPLPPSASAATNDQISPPAPAIAAAPARPRPTPPQSPASGQNSPVAPSAAPEPPYISLSFRPGKAVPLLDIPPDYFAVQLIAVSDRETLEAYALENGLIGLSATRVRSGKAIFYVLILGVYETKDKAELAVASLSGSMRSLNPWIRTVASLQEAILAAKDINR